MKAEDLKFPMVVYWVSSDSIYAVEDNDGYLCYTKIGQTCAFYPNSTGKQTLADLIKNGHVTVLAQPGKNATLTIDVDATQATAKLEAATKAASELATALASVKEFLK